MSARITPNSQRVEVPGSSGIFARAALEEARGRGTHDPEDLTNAGRLLAFRVHE